MSRLYTVGIILVCLALASLACQVSVNPGNFQTVAGSGNLVAEEREVSGVNRVAVNNQGNLEITIGAEEKLVIEAEDNLLQYITSEVRGGELRLATQSNINLRNKQPIRYLLTVKSLDGLTINSSGNINAPELQAKKFKIDVNSSGDTIIQSLIADQLDLSISSSGDVTILGGDINEQNITISSSGSYYAQNVTTQRATVKISSSGNANIRVSDYLKVDLTSSGDVKYIGDPRMDINESSSGKAQKIGN